MKQVHPNYTFVASTKTITLTGLNIAQDQLLLITNATRGVIYYNFASSSHRATVTAGANTTVVLTDASTAGHADSDQLVVHYDDQLFTQTIAGTVTVSNTTISSPVFVKICGEMSGAGPNEPREIQTDDSGLLYVRLAPSNSLVSDPVVYDPVAGAAYINVRQYSAVTVGNSVTIGSLPAISGTVTANLDGDSFVIASQVETGIASYAADLANDPFPISGTVTVGNSVTIGSLPAISGTVTAAAPNGSLTTRFGTPTTANTAFATSAVTNANRKYLLIQNVTTGSNVITVGIGFTPTTTQGIQLTAGAGITFESSYIPTGAVYVLSSVTASNFTILEA